MGLRRRGCARAGRPGEHLARGRRDLPRVDSRTARRIAAPFPLLRRPVCRRARPRTGDESGDARRRAVRRDSLLGHAGQGNPARLSAWPCGGPGGVPLGRSGDARARSARHTRALAFERRADGGLGLVSARTERRARHLSHQTDHGRSRRPRRLRLVVARGHDAPPSPRAWLSLARACSWRKPCGLDERERRSRTASAHSLRWPFSAWCSVPFVTPDVLLRFPPRSEIALPYVAIGAAVALDYLTTRFVGRRFRAVVVAVACVGLAGFGLFRVPTASAAFGTLAGGTRGVLAASTFGLGDGSEVATLAGVIDGLGSDRVTLESRDVPRGYWIMLNGRGPHANGRRLGEARRTQRSRWFEARAQGRWHGCPRRRPVVVAAMPSADIAQLNARCSWLWRGSPGRSASSGSHLSERDVAVAVAGELRTGCHAVAQSPALAPLHAVTALSQNVMHAPTDRARSSRQQRPSRCRMHGIHRGLRLPPRRPRRWASCRRRRKRSGADAAVTPESHV